MSELYGNPAKKLVADTVAILRGLSKPALVLEYVLELRAGLLTTNKSGYSFTNCLLLKLLLIQRTVLFHLH